MPLSYINPGAAFSHSMEDSLARRQAADHQAFLESLAQQREKRLDDADAADRQMRQRDFEMKGEDRERSVLQRRVDQMMPGDVPDTLMIADAHRLGVALPTHQDPAENKVIPAGQAAVPLGAPVSPTGETIPVPPSPEGFAPTMIGGAQPAEPVQGSAPIRFMGSPADQRVIQKKKGIDDFVAGLPARVDALPENDQGARAALAAEYFQVTGVNPPAGMFDKQVPVKTDVPNMRQNKRTGTVERNVDGQWVPWKGDVPPNAHWSDEGVEPDHSAATDNRLDRSWQVNSAQLDKISGPLELQEERLSKLWSSLDAMTPVADSIIAPELLTAIAGGAGSGLRLNEAEIDRVVNARSRWQSLETALNVWKRDPSKALSLTPEQRTDMRSLVRAIGQKVQDRLQRIVEARYALNDAPDVKSHRKIMADLHKDSADTMKMPDEQPTTGAASPDVTALIKHYRDLAAGAK